MNKPKYMPMGIFAQKLDTTCGKLLHTEVCNDLAGVWTNEERTFESPQLSCRQSEQTSRLHSATAGPSVHSQTSDFVYGLYNCRCPPYRRMLSRPLTSVKSMQNKSDQVLSLGRRWGFILTHACLCDIRTACTDLPGWLTKLYSRYSFFVLSLSCCWFWVKLTLSSNYYHWRPLLQYDKTVTNRVNVNI